MATPPVLVVPSCGPWKGVSIFFIIVSIIVIIVFIVLLATKNITFGKTSNTAPTQDQLIAALRAGIKYTTQDAASKSTLTSVVTLAAANTPGIVLTIKSGITTEGVTVPDIGGDGLEYKVVPAATNVKPGVYYDINDTPRIPGSLPAPITAPKYRITVDPTMTAVTYPPGPVLFTGSGRVRRT